MRERLTYLARASARRFSHATRLRSGPSGPKLFFEPLAERLKNLTEQQIMTRPAFAAIRCGMLSIFSTPSKAPFIPTYLPTYLLTYLLT